MTKLKRTTLTSDDEVISHGYSLSRMLREDFGAPVRWKTSHVKIASTIFFNSRLRESEMAENSKALIKMFEKLDQSERMNLSVGTYASLLNIEVINNEAQIWGSLEPKIISKITCEEDHITQIEFNNNPDDVWPKNGNIVYNDTGVSQSAFFPTKDAANKALTIIKLNLPQGMTTKTYLKETMKKINESTTAGSIAPVAASTSKMQRRAKNSIFSGIETAAKTPNSDVVKETTTQTEHSKAEKKNEAETRARINGKKAKVKESRESEREAYLKDPFGYKANEQSKLQSRNAEILKNRERYSAEFDIDPELADNVFISKVLRAKEAIELEKRSEAQKARMQAQMMKAATGVGTKQDTEAKIAQLMKHFDPEYEYSDDHSHWTKHHQMNQKIGALKDNLKKLNESALSEAPRTAKPSFKKNLLAILQSKYPNVKFKVSSDRVESEDGQLCVIADEATEGKYTGCYMWDVTVGPYNGAMMLAIKQTTEQLLAVNPNKKPALFIGGSNDNPDAWNHIAQKLKYKLITDEGDDDGLWEGHGFDKWTNDRAASQGQQGVAEGLPKNDKDEFKRQALLVKDRKTGKLYDPNKEFDKKMKSPEVMAQMKRMAAKEGVAEGSRTPQDWEVKSAVWGLDKRGVHQEPQDVKSHFVRADRRSRAEEKAKREYEPGRSTWEIHPRGNKEQGVAEGQLTDKIKSVGKRVGVAVATSRANPVAYAIRKGLGQSHDEYKKNIKSAAGVAEGPKEKTPGVALSKAYKKDFDGIKPVNRRPETALTGTYSKTGKPGGELKKRSVAEGMSDRQWFNNYEEWKRAAKQLETDDDGKDYVKLGGNLIARWRSNDGWVDGSTQKSVDESLNINDVRHPGYAYTQAATNNHTVNEFAPGGNFKPPVGPSKNGKDPFGDDNRSKIAASVEQLLDSGNKVDWVVPGQMGHVVRAEPDGITMKRWQMPRSKKSYFLPMPDDSRDNMYFIKLVKPGYYRVIQNELGDDITTNEDVSRRGFLRGAAASALGATALGAGAKGGGGGGGHGGGGHGGGAHASGRAIGAHASAHGSGGAHSGPAHSTFRPGAPFVPHPSRWHNDATAADDAEYQKFINHYAAEIRAGRMTPQMRAYLDKNPKIAASLQRGPGGLSKGSYNADLVDLEQRRNHHLVRESRTLKKIKESLGWVNEDFNIVDKVSNEVESSHKFEPSAEQTLSAMSNKNKYKIVKGPNKSAKK
jgi:hypothetical protein